MERQVAAPGAADRRPARRLADHPGQARAAEGAGGPAHGASAAAATAAAPLTSTGTSCGESARGAPVPDGDAVRLAAGLLEPARQRPRSTPTRAAHRAAASRGGSVKPGLGPRRRHRHRRPSCCPHVFDLFVQADHSIARSSGLGIGLTLVRRLVELHGGTVRRASDGPGPGQRVHGACAGRPRGAHAPAAAETAVPRGTRVRCVWPSTTTRRREPGRAVAQMAALTVETAY